MLIEPPVLVMPNTQDPFQLYSDTSKVACGAALYQVQEGVPHLVTYNSKKLPDAASRYGISELEMNGLLQNMKLFKWWLFRKHFEAIVDHSALPHILWAKKEPTTLYLKKYVEELSEFSFDCRYQKGKDMQVANYLSRHNDNDVSEPSDITPISDVCNAITQGQAKTAGVKPPDLPWDRSDLLPEKCDQ